MDFQDLKEKIQSVFDIEVDISMSIFKVFNDGILLKKSNENNYCFLRNYGNDCKIVFFNSDFKDISDIEDDYLHYGISFLINSSDLEEAKKLIDWFI